MFSPCSWKRFWQLSALSLLVVWLVCACGNSPPQSAKTAVDSDCRQIEHAMGTTCVPRQPQRLIVLSSTILESTLVLEQKPIASQTDVLPYLEDRLQGIEVLGWPLNLEKVLALQPDLIIGLASSQEQQTYQLLSQIAPTVLAQAETSGDWKAVVEFVGEVLGKPDAADRVLADYQERLQTFQEQMGEKRQETEVSVIRLYPDKINVYIKDSFIGTILTDAGLERPPAQQLNADQGLTLAGNPIQMPISKERLSDADGDVIFIVTYSDQSQIEQELQENLKQLQKDPLWSRLEAVKQGQVYTVGSHWIASGPLAANEVIDDLFEYLPSAPNDPSN